MSGWSDTLGSITDYRESGLLAPTADHMDRWATQFDAMVQSPILRELGDLPKKAYFSRDVTKKHMLGLFKTETLVNAGP